MVQLIWCTRSISERFLHHATWLNGRGVQLRSLTENLIDTTSPSGTLVFGIFGLMADSSATCYVNGRTPGWPLLASAVASVGGLGS